MKMTNSLDIQHAQAAEKIIEPILEGRFTYGKKEKIFYFFIAPVISAYLSWEFVRFYFEDSGTGSVYLPICKFDTRLGAEPIYFCNLSFYWFFTLNMFVTLRKSYSQYQFIKELGLTPPKFNIFIKSSITLLFSIAAGTMMAMLVGDKHGNYHQFISGLVSVFLNIIGSNAFMNLLLEIFFGLKNIFFRKAEDEIDVAEEINTSSLDKKFKQCEKILKRIPNQSPMWKRLNKKKRIH